MPKKLTILLTFLFLFLLSYHPILAQTNDWGNINSNCIDDSTGVEIATLQGLECIFANVISIIIPVAGLGSFIVLIVGGFQYLTSAGDPKQVQKAQGIITGAIIGVAVTAGVLFIFRFLNLFTDLDLFQFVIPGP